MQKRVSDDQERVRENEITLPQPGLNKARVGRHDGDR